MSAPVNEVFCQIAIPLLFPIWFSIGIHFLLRTIRKCGSFLIIQQISQAVKPGGLLNS